MAKDTSDVEDVDLAPIESLTAFGSTSSGGASSTMPGSDLGTLTSGGVPASYVPGRSLGVPGTEPEPLPPASIESLTTPPAAVTEGMSDLYRTKIARQDAMFAETERRLEEDRARMRKAYDATGIQPGEFQPWDADKQREKYSTEPLQAFGSLGSVFAMIASAFTRDPMTNALNGAAAAMTAIRDGDERNYQRAYTAWKDNTDLAVKRHNIQQQAYTNAITLMDSDMKLGTAKAAMEAARFGDQKSLFLINNGMLPEFIDLQIKRNQAVTTGIEAGAKLTEDQFRRATLKTMADEYDTQAATITGQSPTEIAGRKLALYNHIFGKNQPVPQEAFGLLLAGMPDKPIEEVIKKAQDLGLMPRGLPRTTNNPEWIFINQRAAELQKPVAEGGEGLGPTEAMAQAKQEWKIKSQAPAREGTEADFIRKRVPELVLDAEERGELLDETEATRMAKTEWANAARKGSRQAQGAETFEAILKKVEQEHPDWEPGDQRAEANRREAASKNVTSGNKKVDLQHRINNFGIAIDTADKIIEVVERRKNVAGIFGKVMRIEERIGNIVGSNQSERVQMMRDVELLRGMAKELINSKNERLKSEGQRINDIIGGTSAGDTGPNTIAALKAAKKLFARMRQEDMEILQGRGPGSSAPAPPTNEPPAGTWTPPAHDKPLKKSSLEDEEQEPTAFAPGTTAPILSAEQFIRDPGRAQVRRPMPNLSEQEVTVGEPIDVPEGEDAMEVYRRQQRRRR